MAGAFKKIRQAAGRRPPATIKDVTLSDFSGGLLITDDQINQNPKYSTALINILPDDERSQVLRFGTKQFCQCAANVVNMTYFRQRIIAVLTDGTIEAIDDDGNRTVIWNNTIASALPGSPSGWSSGLTNADFTEFRGELVIVNGTDKPVIVSISLAVTFLQDIPSGSNVNTPIGSLITTVANFVVMAGITNEDTVIYISSSGTSGTWSGDPIPNDATTFDVGAFSGQASSKITALASFKNFLIVYFENLSVVIELGTFDSTPAHVPNVVDTYAELGTINNKTIITTENDLFYASRIGIFSGKRTVFGDTINANSVSEALGDTYPAALGLVNVDSVNSFAVLDTLSRTVFFIFHKSDSTVQAWALRYQGNFTRFAWGELAGWDYTSGCKSERGRVFFAKDNIIYQYGNSVFTDEDYAADNITIANPDGTAIDFSWETPWISAGNRIKLKKLVNVTYDTTGTAPFKTQLFVNNFYQDTNGNRTPALEMDFVAGTFGGYGNNAEGYGGDGYGGGRRANDERFFGVPLKYKILKHRIEGSVRQPIRFISISFVYQQGNYQP